MRVRFENLSREIEGGLYNRNNLRSEDSLIEAMGSKIQAMLCSPSTFKNNRIGIIGVTR